MDASFESEGRAAPPATQALGAGGAIPAARPAATLPAWVQGLSAAALFLALAALTLGTLLFTAMLQGDMARPAALLLAGVALAVGSAALVARLVHTTFVGRLALLSQALEASPQAHLIVAPDGGAAYANAAFRHFFGTHLRPLEAIGRAIAPGDSSAADFARLALDASERGSTSGRIAIARGSSGQGWFGVTAHRLAGRPGFTLWSFEDVTARHEMEQVIRDEQRKLADFLDSAPVGFYSVDAAGRFLFVNEALAEWLGATPGALVEGAAKLGDFVAGPVPLGALPHAPFAGGGERTGEVILKGRQGRIFHAFITQSVVRAADGLRTRSIVRDLSPEREHEEEARLSRQRYQGFFANAPVGIALVGRGGKLEEANGALSELLGLAP